MILSLFLLSILGLFLSCYALYIEWKTRTTSHYQALCDLAQHVSCTKAFTSPYGQLLGLPNAAYGACFYIITAFLASSNLTSYLFYLSIAAFLGTLLLAYFSYYKMKNFCVVCSSIYLINIALLIISYRAL